MLCGLIAFPPQNRRSRWFESIADIRSGSIGPVKLTALPDFLVAAKILHVLAGPTHRTLCLPRKGSVPFCTEKIETDWMPNRNLKIPKTGLFAKIMPRILISGEFDWLSRKSRGK